MKKFFITLAFVAAACFAQAQFFIGGNIGYISNGGTGEQKQGKETTSINLPKTTSFTIAPSVGFMFKENMGVGLDIAYTSDKYKYETKLTSYTRKQSGFEFAPYFRFVFGDFSPVKLYVDGRINYGSGSVKITRVDEEDVTRNYDGDKYTTFGIAVVPGIQYNITDNISVNAKVNLLSLGYVSTKYITNDVDNFYDYIGYDVDDYETREDDEDIEYTANKTQFGLGINKSTVLEIGFFYTF